MSTQNNKKSFTTMATSDPGPKPAPKSTANPTSQDPCGICTKPLTLPKETLCGHVFCSTCVFDHFKDPCPTRGTKIFQKPDMAEVEKNRAERKQRGEDVDLIDDEEADDDDDDDEDEDEGEGHFRDHKFNSSQIGCERKADYMDEFGGDAWDGL